MQAQQINAEVSVNVKIRYRDDVTSRHRVIFGDRTLEIVSVLRPDNRKTELNLLCVESPDA